MAICGMDISQLIPTHIWLGYKDKENIEHSLLTSDVASAVINYMANADGAEYDGLPFTRVSINLNSASVRESAVPTSGVNALIQLRTSTGKVLAEVEADIMNTLSQVTSGTQVIIVWDLYISNNKDNKGEG